MCDRSCPQDTRFTQGSIRQLVTNEANFVFENRVRERLSHWPCGLVTSLGLRVEASNIQSDRKFSGKRNFSLLPPHFCVICPPGSLTFCTWFCTSPRLTSVRPAPPHTRTYTLLVTHIRAHSCTHVLLHTHTLLLTRTPTHTHTSSYMYPYTHNHIHTLIQM